MDERCCRFCGRLLVRGAAECGRSWASRRHCNMTCKTKLAHQLATERARSRAAARAVVGGTPDFRPHETSPRDGGPLPRIDRPLGLLRSMTGSSADW